MTQTNEWSEQVQLIQPLFSCISIASIEWIQQLSTSLSVCDTLFCFTDSSSRWKLARTSNLVILWDARTNLQEPLGKERSNTISGVVIVQETAGDHMSIYAHFHVKWWSENTTHRLVQWFAYRRPVIADISLESSYFVLSWRCFGHYYIFFTSCFGHPVWTLIISQQLENEESWWLPIDQVAATCAWRHSCA